MQDRIQLVSVVAAAGVLFIVFELVRRRRLMERYALLWLLTGSVVLLFAVWRGLLGWAADTVGIAYPPSALFVLASFLCALAPTLSLLIAFRVLQGAVAGPMIPLSQ